MVKRLAESYEGKLLVKDRVEGDHTKGSKFILLLKEFISS